MVYVLSIGPGKLLKIGYTSKRIEERVAQLQTGCPFEITPLFTVQGTLLQEKEIHKALRKGLNRRNETVNGEWYSSRSKYIKEFLPNLRLGCDMGLAFLDSDEHGRKYRSTVAKGLTRRQREKLKESRREQRTLMQECVAVWQAEGVPASTTARRSVGCCDRTPNPTGYHLPPRNG